MTFKRFVSLLPLMRTALLLPLIAGCVVPQTRYEEARSVVAVEQEAHRRTLAELAVISNKLAKAENAIREREKRLEQRDQKIAEAELAQSISQQERQSASDLVDQLRGELSRVGDHLRAFADEKKRLADALSATKARADRLAEAEKTVASRADLVRDLSILLHKSIALGSIELSAREGRVELLIPKDELGEKPGPVAGQAFAAISRVAKLRKSLKFELSDAAAVAAPPNPAPTEANGAPDVSQAKAPSPPNGAPPPMPLSARVQAELVSQGIAAERLKIGKPVEATSVDGVVVFMDG